MVPVTIIAVGKLGEKHWTAASGEYIKRLGAFCRPEIIEISETKLQRNPSAGEVLRALESEGEAIFAKVPQRAHVFSLCVEGEAISSEALAAKLDDIMAKSLRTVFVIGGSRGLSDRVKQASHTKLSLSGMTFPHQFARIMLLEQVYRAFTINAGMPYHK